MSKKERIYTEIRKNIKEVYGHRSIPDDIWSYQNRKHLVDVADLHLSTDTGYERARSKLYLFYEIIMKKYVR